MKAALAVALLLSISSVVSGYEYAWCQFQGTSNNPGLNGYAYFQTSSTSGAIDMIVSVSGVTVNLGINHGIHIHQYGDLSDTVAAASVGSHYSPTGLAHGCPDEGSPDWHDGDTGNWMVYANGTISGTKTLTDPKLSGVDSIIGRAVVIHSFTDDCNITASAQSRLGFCVIGIANPMYSLVNTTANDASNGAASGTIPVGVCDLQPIAGSGVGGRIWLTPSANGLTVDALVTGLTGTHGFHIHQYGDLRLNDTGNSTGGHYNPYSANHGIPPYVDRHLGDMGNLYYAANTSTLAYSYFFNSTGNGPAITLTGLYNVIGRGIVVHSAPDNCAQPTGNSGSRIAFCVIGIGNSSATTLIDTAAPNVNTTQDDSACIALASPSPTASPAAAVSASASPAAASASASPATAVSASASPAVASASSSPDGSSSDSFASSVVPCFVAVLCLAAAILF